MKRKITQAEFDALNDAIKAHYKKEGDVYLLQVDDATELLAARDREKQRADDAIAEAQRLKDEKAAADRAAADAIEQAKRDKAKADGDTTALENSWKDKVAQTKADGEAETARLRKMLEGVTVDNAALTMANDISTDPDLILPIIRGRLVTDFTGDKPLVRVVDAEGKPSAQNLDDLKKELVANPKYARIIKGTNASGGSANEGGSGGSATKKISEMSETERVALHRANPDAYRTQAAAEGLPVYS